MAEPDPVHDEIYAAAVAGARIKAQHIRESVGLDPLRRVSGDSSSDAIVLDAVNGILETVSGGETQPPPA